MHCLLIFLLLGATLSAALYLSKQVIIVYHKTSSHLQSHALKLLCVKLVVPFNMSTILSLS